MLMAAGLSSSNKSPDSMSGLSDFQILESLIGEEGPIDEALIATYLRCLSSTLEAGSVVPFDQAWEALFRLDERGVRNVIVTGNHPEGAQLKIRAAGCLDVSMNTKVYGSSTQEPDRLSIAAGALRDLGVNRAVFVGDSLNDVEAARQLGSPCVAVATGHHSDTQLKEAGATVTLGKGYVWSDLVLAITSCMS